jgi:hypothetical protein
LPKNRKQTARKSKTNRPQIKRQTENKPPANRAANRSKIDVLSIKQRKKQQTQIAKQINIKTTSNFEKNPNGNKTETAKNLPQKPPRNKQETKPETDAKPSEIGLFCKNTHHF